MADRKKSTLSCTVARLLAVAMLLSGCAAPSALPSKAPADQSNANARQTPDRPAIPTMSHHQTSGSLWTDNGALTTMFINAKARNVGDIVTIKIVETSSASNKATTDTDRSSSLGIGLTSFFNLEDQISASDKFFNPFAPVQSEYSSDFAGSGATARSGELSAYITARIIQILPNGNLIIEGNREVRINHENQVITLTGVVRPRDISAQNIIQSTYIADAKISYSGSGIINEQQRPGWLTRILDRVWPF